jgi:hypothetical protein
MREIKNPQGAEAPRGPLTTPSRTRRRTSGKRIPKNGAGDNGVASGEDVDNLLGAHPPEKPEDDEDDDDEAYDRANPRDDDRNPCPIFIANEERYVVLGGGLAGRLLRSEIETRYSEKAAVRVYQDLMKRNLELKVEDDEAKRRIKRCLLAQRTGIHPQNARMVQIGRGFELNTNLYMLPFPEEGETDDFWELVKYQCGGDEAGMKWVRNWLGYICQDKYVKPGVALVMHGVPGTGKTQLGRMMGILRGAMTIIDQAALEGAFNSHWAQHGFVLANEVFLGEGKLVHQQRWKAWITDHSGQATKKYADSGERQNHITWALTSNSDLPVHIEKGDRRFTVFRATMPEKGLLARWKKGWAEYDRADECRLWEMPILKAVAWELEHMEVNVEAARKPFENDARLAIREASASSWELFSLDLVREGLKSLSEKSGLGLEVLPLADAQNVEPELVAKFRKRPEDWQWAEGDYMYREYDARCKNTGYPPVGIAKFRQVFDTEQFPSVRLKREGTYQSYRLVPLKGKE